MSSEKAESGSEYGYREGSSQPSANYYEEENKLLKATVSHLRNELMRLRQPPLMLSEVISVFDDKAVIVISNGNRFMVNVASNLQGKVKVGSFVLVEQKNLNIVDIVKSSIGEMNAEKFVIIEKPEADWSQIGGLHDQIQELKEVIELPLMKPELFKKIGIIPPKGILLYGSPGTGKTLLAKAVAASTNSTFIELVGSELVQKFIGEGAKLVREMFKLAKEKAPTIIFIDEIDSIAAKRIELGTSGEREVQRTFMQLLAEIDGFKNLDNVKVIGCTNRRDIVDPAILRPGRLDRQIYIPLPDDQGREQIFRIHTGMMRLSKTVKLDIISKKCDGFSGAEIRAVCTEAGYFAIRAGKSSVTMKDFEKAIEKVKQSDEIESRDYQAMFG
ncbi:MAG TPA: AAA family ATPase [Candidatus Woesearchaeota archaeon]|nr:AAA family ATPase [Candidatus Woesearchaeota archaeon]